ncbi:MAG: DUF3892 domain-containing protein [Polaromonas sp.]|nr:DUF3892 domain-containing protein [Polaromonas sp.]
MAKTGDFLVIGVRMDADNQHINQLKVKPFTASDKVGDDAVMSRPEAVKMIEAGKLFYSGTLGADRKWNIGAQVQVISVTTKFLKTKADQSSRDNLENLPKF